MRINTHLASRLAVAALALPMSSGLTAQSLTVSAKGSVTVAGTSCNLAEPNPDDQCHAGGSGARINFSFQGTRTTPGGAPVPASGTLSAFFADTGLQVELLAAGAVILPNAHQLNVVGTCQTRDALGQIVAFGTGSCFFSAMDNTPNGAVDEVALVVFAVSGFIQASGQPANGNVNIE